MTTTITIEPGQARLDEHAGRAHPACHVCAADAPDGLRMQFRVQPDGAVEAFHQPDAAWQGYSGILHGGMTATLLDAAMTHALFARGVAAVTARLEVRYRQPVRPDQPVRVRGWLVKATPPVYRVAADMRQGAARVAQATAVFMEMPSPSAHRPPATAA